MNIYAWVLLAAVAAAAVADWVAVARRQRAAEQLAKPAVVVLLLALAWLWHADQSGSGRFLLVALALCLAGDVLLLLRSDRGFAAGLVAFLVAHLAWMLAVALSPRAAPVWFGVAATLVVLGLALWLLLWPFARRDPREGGPPTAYALVLGALVAVAWWSGILLVALGASLFLLSDAVLAANRFWRRLPGAPVVVMVTYHLALVTLVVGVLRPDLSPA